MSKIKSVEVTEYTFESKGLEISGNGQSIVCKKDSKITSTRFAVRIFMDDGTDGQYVLNWGGLRGSLGQVQMLAPHLIGRDPEMRERIYDDLKREIRQLDHFGHGPLDIALWDWAGKKHNTPIYKLLGAYRTSFPAYASTYHGDNNGMLSSKEAYADFAAQCYDMGYRHFKIHGWNQGDARREADNVRHLANKMGDKMGLMLDMACELRTYADALYVGRACDDGNYLWYEDPFRDGGVSAFAHRQLRAALKTPLLQTEHVRGVEPKADFLIAGGTDYLRADPEYDLGITGVMKIAHLAEAFGTDVELHATGPAHRHCLAAIRNSSYYEVALVGPGAENAVPQVYKCGYSDQIDCIDKNGHVHVPEGPGLGVTYDWDYIYKNKVSQSVIE